MIIRCIFIGCLVLPISFVLICMLLYSSPSPTSRQHGQWHENLTWGQALMVEILPAAAGCIIPGAIIGGIVGFLYVRGAHVLI